MQIEKRAFTIIEFCQAYGVSRAKLYLLWAEAVGPRRTRIGVRVYILVADADAWIAGHREVA